MKAQFEIRLVRRVDPAPQPAAADEFAVAPVEQRPVLDAVGALPVDLGAQLLLDLRRGELAAGIDQGHPRGIAPRLRRTGQVVRGPRAFGERPGSALLGSDYER